MLFRRSRGSRKSASRKHRRTHGQFTHQRKALFEQLEDRRLLAVYASDVPQSIPDQGMVESTLMVDDSVTIGDLNVTLDISHTRDKDLDVFLVGPDGTRVQLMTDVGGNGNNFQGTLLDDEAASSITLGSAPFTGSYQPEGTLSSFDGKSAQGTWTLEVTDDQKRDTGMLNSWSIEVTPAGPVLPNISIDDVQLVEGDSGTTALVFTVSRSGDTSGTSSVDFTTTDGTASAGSDYVSSNGTLQFLAGETSKTINVQVNGDADIEPDESFTVDLANPTDAVITDGQGLGTLLDDDALPTISIADVSVIEGAIASSVTTFNDPTPTTQDHFGRAVEMHGNRILVGAQNDDSLGIDVGQAHLFDTDGNLLQTFNDPTPTAGDFFGHIVSFDGNRALVGAPHDDTFGEDVGQAHLFDMTTGSLLQTFDDPTPTVNGQFGWGVAIDGNNVLVSADRSNAEEGRAYLFDATTGDLLHTFADPTPTNGDQFGHFAAIDGDYVVVGTPRDGTQGYRVGQVHVFDTVTGNLLRTIDNPSPEPDDHFGHSVWVDGNNVLVGAWGDDTLGTNVGQAYLFDAVTGDLLQTYDDPTPTTEDEFSRELSIEGDHVLIGARLDDTFGENVGQAHLFDRLTGELVQTFDDPTITIGDAFGRSMALDGNNVVVGAFKDNTLGFEVGQVHLFTHSEPAAEFSVNLSAPSDEIVTVNFDTANGTATAGSDYTAASGTVTFAPGETTQTILVSTTDDTVEESSESFFVNLSAASGAVIQDGQGEATIIDDDALPAISIADVNVTEGAIASSVTTFNDPTVTTQDHFGRTVEIHGNRILVGAQDDDTLGVDVGQAHLFDTDGNLLRTFDNPTPTEGDLFGRLVSFDGNRALIGASGADRFGIVDVGQAYLFDMTTGSLLQTFDDPTPTVNGQFGWGAAIDGNNVLVSAYQNNTDGGGVGRAYLFDADSGDLLQTFTDPTPTNTDEFGHFAALDGNYVLVGAPTDDTNGYNVGQAHLFDVGTGDLLRTFDNPSPGSNDRFGHSVWVDGENILIGAWSDDTLGTDVGQAYLFDALTGDLLQTYNDPTPTTADQFSRELAIEGDHVLIGAKNDDTFGENVGQVHLFDRLTGELLQTFNDPTIMIEDRFGRSMALEGNKVVVGAWKDNTLGFQVGQVHLFTLSEPAAEFSVNLSAPSDEIVTVDFDTANGTAIAGSDYTATSGTLTFAPGETTQSFIVPTIDDAVEESTESFFVNLSAATGAVIQDGQGEATILDNDAAPSMDAIYVYDISFESKRGNKDWRAVFEIRTDSNANGLGDSGDLAVAGVQIEVTFAGQTYTGTTDANGIFRTNWIRNLSSASHYANAIDLALTDFEWNPLDLDLENDSDGDGKPDDLLLV